MMIRVMWWMLRHYWGRWMIRNAPIRWIIVWAAKVSAKRMITERARNTFGSGLVDSKFARQSRRRFWRGSVGKGVLDMGVGRPVSWSLRRLIRW